MTVVKKKRQQQKKRKTSGLDLAISKLFTTASPTLSFEFEDGSKLVQPINKSFLYQDNKSRAIYSIKNDLFAMKEDLMAKLFRI